MSTFLGIGFGPIQTGIFLLGASKGGFDRIVGADVDKALVESLRAGGGVVTINIATKDRIYQEKIRNVEIHNPHVVAHGPEPPDPPVQGPERGADLDGEIPPHAPSSLVLCLPNPLLLQASGKPSH